MRSTIYASDTIMNISHEFGESSAARYWVMFIDERGVETPIALTQNQIEGGVLRAQKEPLDRDLFLKHYSRSAINGVDVAKIVAALLFVGAVGIGIGWATGLLP